MIRTKLSAAIIGVAAAGTLLVAAPAGASTGPQPLTVRCGAWNATPAQRLLCHQNQFAVRCYSWNATPLLNLLCRLEGVRP